MPKPEPKTKPRSTVGDQLISDTTIAHIRAAAHRYLLAGGGVFGDAGAAGLDENIALIVDRLDPTLHDEVETAMIRLCDAAKAMNVPDEPSEAKIYEEIGMRGEAGFLFGVAVAQELAGWSYRLPRVKKGGAR